MARSTLLFIVDISGFTRFMSSRSPEDGVRAAKEMLQIILESNKMGLKLCEIEGDAVFFYSNSRNLRFNRLLRQVRATYRHFNKYLHKNELEGQLGIKFIAHAGTCPKVKVGGKAKLFGKEVIRVHRLLKSRADDMNYFLVTEPAAALLGDLPCGEKGTARFEHLGAVDYRVFGQSFLRVNDSAEMAKPVAGFLANMKYIVSSLLNGDAVASAAR